MPLYVLIRNSSMVKHGFILLVLLAAQGLCAQPFTLSGTVRDSTSGQPLSRAAVVIDYDRFASGTLTDAQGHFSITLGAGNHIVVVRYLGYLSFRQTISLAHHRELDIRLSAIAGQLEEVIVTSKGYDRNVQQPLLGVSQVNIKTIKRMPAALGEVDILRSLQLLPGVTSVGEAANGVNIRGGNTDQNLILLDDTPIFNPTHMFGLFSVFPPDAVSGLDLYKGNVPARYGGRAAAVLDVALQNPNLEQFRLAGGASLVANRLTLDIPISKGKLGVLLSARGAFNDFLLPIASQKLENIRARFGDGVIKAFWRVNSANTVVAMGYVSNDFFQTDLLGSIANINATATQYDHQTTNAMIRWFHAFSPRTNLQTTALVAHYTPAILSVEPSANKVRLEQSLVQRQVKSNLNSQRERHKLEVGLSATQYRLNPGDLLPGSSTSVNYRSTPPEQALELAAHTEAEWSITDKLAVSAGLRYSRFLNLGPATVRQYAPGEGPDEAFMTDSVRYGAGQVTAQYGGFEPRLGVRYAVGANASVKIGYNLMRQYVQSVTNTTTPLPTARWKTADAYIQPQLSQLISAGWFQNLKSNIYELSAEVYWRSTQNVVDYKPGADLLLQPYPETQLLQGRSRAYGVELMLARKKGELTGWINYTYARTQNQVAEGANFRQRINGGDWYNANYDRPHSLNASLNINQGKHHAFAFNFVYSTGRPYTAPEGFIRYGGRTYPYYDERNQYRLPDYHRLDFSWTITNATMKNRRWQGRWTFTVYNLYARANAYSIFFRTEGQATKPYKLTVFGSPIPSLTYNFDVK
ncbi:TonB-dependent receptor [Fibrella arboris]|uniref:TonB-dependent receptor n=1 Tax=Fibrella arboris TaxID=3242486 RepID=UPI0035218ED5